MAIECGAAMLRTRRFVVEPWRAVREAIVVAGTGGDEVCSRAVSAAGRAARDGIYVVAKCFDRDGGGMAALDQVKPNCVCIDEINAAVANLGLEDFEAAPDVVPPAGLHSITITETLPANISVRAGSALPGATSQTPNELVWEFRNVVSGHVLTMTYGATPLQQGSWPVSVGAVASFIDTRGRSGTAVFPIPVVDVMAQSQRGSPSPTAVATSTATPPAATIRPSSTSTPNPIAESRDVYCPYGSR